MRVFSLLESRGKKKRNAKTPTIAFPFILIFFWFKVSRQFSDYFSIHLLTRHAASSSIHMCDVYDKTAINRHVCVLNGFCYNIPSLCCLLFAFDVCASYTLYRWIINIITITIDCLSVSQHLISNTTWCDISLINDLLLRIGSDWGFVWGEVDKGESKHK